MEQALAKIRPHTASSLAHQRTPATLLLALESTLKEQNTEPSPTAYFAALLTTLDGTIQKKEHSLDDDDVLPAELYLLALVSPYVATPVLRGNLNTILSLTAPLFPSLVSRAPALRSQLTLYHTLFQALDRTQLEIQGIRQTFASILQLAVDPRPKVRKKAADVIKDVLASPPPPLAQHPYSGRVSDWIQSILTDVNSGPVSGHKAGKVDSPRTETAIHLLAFLRPLLANLPVSSLPTITNSLLLLPRLGNPYLSRSAYSIISDLFSLTDEDGMNIISGQVSGVLEVMLSSAPAKSDIALTPAWVQVLGNAMLAYSSIDSEACAREIGKVWNVIWPTLESSDASSRKSAAQALGILCRCYTLDHIASALSDKDAKSVLGGIIRQVVRAFETLQYARSMPELLSVTSSLITGLRFRTPYKTSPTAAESLLLPLITKIGDLRTQKGFEYKESADATLTTAMQTLGPHVLLQILPLNLEPIDREANREPRAYLLPLLSHPHPSPLCHFVSYFVPLSERMFDLQQKADREGRQSEAKVWSVLVAQIWSGLAGYCSGATDLEEALGPAFSQLLSQLLYSQPELRPAVLKALKVLVDANISVVSPKSNQVQVSEAPSVEDATNNLVFLRSQTESWLAVFFNVFGSVGRDGRGMVGDVISSWASIAGEQEIAKAYAKVIDLFKTHLATQQKASPPNDSGSITTTTQDILILLLPHLSVTDATVLFNICMTSAILSGRDHGVQKRGYKILAKLVESGKFTIDGEAILRQLDVFMDGLAPAAKKDRFNLLTLVIPLIPSSAMHIIPSLIPEAVLGTKEPSEKARMAAFDLILCMGEKMNEGGVVKRSMMDGADDNADDTGEDASANIEEFMTMVAGGLAGASPHMISATVTAISRLIFEFKDNISPKMHTEILTTLLVFLISANREIVKSILGFVKLAIHTLPTDLVRPHLNELVPALLTWSHDHKNHFKAKVRHIFERLLRRFTWDEVYACAGEGDASKVLVNIKKRKDRAKRKKAARGDVEDGDIATAKPATGDAFEDVIYGSESELDDSEDEVLIHKDNGVGKRKKQEGARLRVDDDEPMDLLQGAVSRITNTTPNRRRKPGQDASHFKTDEDTGKMIIDDQASESENGVLDKGVIDVTGSAYRESMTSVDGFTRGANGRVKFNKDTKKRRREHEDTVEDVEMADVDVNHGKIKPAKRRQELRLGHEFKAKKAGGDVKKGGVDPYAYMTLSQAAKKPGRGGRNHIGIAGKR